MTVFRVNSIPLKDVIISLAKSFGVPYKNECDEYSLILPEHIGEGEIRGINFENGLALLIYKATFKDDIRLEFTLNEIHPVKFINSLHGPLSHEFSNEGIKHSIEEFTCAIVASERKYGHIIEFEKDMLHEVVSVEIDRTIFSRKENCELKAWKSKLQKVLTDVEGKEQFYHIENCGVHLKDILKEKGSFEHFVLARKLNLKSITIQMFISQLVQFDDDHLDSDQRTILRIQELKRVEELGEFIKENLAEDHSIKNLCRRSGLNPNKLQKGFNYLFSTTINEFITNQRLERAKILLENKEYNVQAVVAAIGLESSSYFSKIYKERYGIAPKNYKKLFS